MNKMQQVKREFFALRNGEMGRQLRALGVPYQIIFGLNLPQIVGVASRFAPDDDLGRQLWANTSTRESLLLAPMLMDPSTFAEEEAERWISEITSAEVADVLCHRLLRRTPYAASMAQRLSTDERPMVRYTALRLMANLLQLGKYDLSAAEKAAREELKKTHPLTASLCRLLLDMSSDF